MVVLAGNQEDATPAVHIGQDAAPVALSVFGGQGMPEAEGCAALDTILEQCDELWEKC